MSFSHLRDDGTPGMVDVDSKAVTERTATARGRIHLGADVMTALRDGDIHTKKGAVFQTAILAGIMAAKRTAEMIPLCHQLPLSKVTVDIEPVDGDAAEVTCYAKATHKTGVEMEALTGVSVACLTIYDMCKSFGHGMAIGPIVLIEKSGGRRTYQRKD